MAANKGVDHQLVSQKLGHRMAMHDIACYFSGQKMKLKTRGHTKDYRHSALIEAYWVWIVT